MPGLVQASLEPQEELLGYLEQQRNALRISAFGLSDEQARLTPTASVLSVGGIIEHVASVERYWIDIVAERVEPFAPSEDYADTFRMTADETLEAVLDDYSGAALETQKVIDSISNLEHAVPVPPGVPWFPKDVDSWSVRWVLLHLIEETARHAGHADIVREAIDGATAFPLMAAVEHWPANPWISPWEPKR